MNKNKKTDLQPENNYVLQFLCFLAKKYILDIIIHGINILYINIIFLH